MKKGVANNKKRYFGLLIVVIAVVLAGMFTWWQASSTQPTLNLAKDYEVTILRDKDELIQGLSGTKTLAPNHVMLFDFGSEDKWSIWMKDMYFAIDIIWLDSGGKVVHMVKNAPPSSYVDNQNAEIFRPSQNARYVIEAVSGTIEGTGIKNGDIVNLPSGAN